MQHARGRASAFLYFIVAQVCAATGMPNSV